jgi:hypothetical protein
MITRTDTWRASYAVVQTAALEFDPVGPIAAFPRPATSPAVGQAAVPASVRRDGAAGLVPVRVDSADGRFYQVGAELFPSVTHALSCVDKPALKPWVADQERTAVLEACAQLYTDCGKVVGAPRLPTTGFIATLVARLPKLRAYQKTLAKAGDIGHQAHRAIERLLRQQLGQAVGPAPKLCAEAQAAVEAFLVWAASVKLRPVAVEVIVYSLTHRYAGTLDLVAYVNGELVVVDFKTGKRIYAEASLQNVAYQQAYAEMGLGPVAGGLVVRLPKRVNDPSFEVGRVPAVDSLYPTFLAVLQVWSWWHQAEQAGKASRRAAAIAARSAA